MTLQAGIVGLPNVGKSTLFNAITRASAEVANYPFCTIDPNVGVVEVPDDRLGALAGVVQPARIVPASVEFVDIAGLVRGASQGEGLGNKFLAHIRNVDAICHVVRCFADSQITHVHGKTDAVADAEVVNLELALADLQTVQRRLSHLAKVLRASRDDRLARQLSALERVEAALQQGLPARLARLSEEEVAELRDLHLLTAKPVLYVANVGEDEVGEATAEPARHPQVAALQAHAAAQEAGLIILSARLEAELQELPGDEQEAFRRELGLAESGLNRLIRAAYRLLALLTFFTAGPKEVRAWTVREGSLAPEAAGVIHSDFQRGFIRAEVIHWSDLVQAGSYAAAREAGLVRLEGKDYRVQDGDVMHFRFHA